MGILTCFAFSLVLLMGDPFRVLTPGDSVAAGEGPFNAQWHNMATEAIRVSQRSTPPGMSPREVVKERDTDIWVANVSEKDVNEFRPVGLGDLAIYPADHGDFRARLCFLSHKLDGGRPFGIVQKPMGAGRLYVCRMAAGPGGQPPNQKWLRLIGEPETWNADRTYVPGEPVIYIGPADAWVDGQTYVAGDLVDAGNTVFRCITAHVASVANAPPNPGYWKTYLGIRYVALVKHSRRVPPANPPYWLATGTHRGIWNRSDTYAIGEVIVEPQLGRVIADGVTRAWLNFKQAAHQHATITNGELQSAAAGPVEILWRQGGLGNQWAVVRLCCGPGLLSPATGGSGEALVAALTCDGMGAYVYRPGGALVAAPMNGAGSGAHTYPTRIGSGTPALGSMRFGGYAKSFSPAPSGSLYALPMSLAAGGTRTSPPAGNGHGKLRSLVCAGSGTRSAPVRSGIGSLALRPFVAGSTGRGGGVYADTAMFVAKMTRPLFDTPSGRWVYDWIEQTINPSSGDYQDLAGGKSGNTSSGPFMCERNNHLVATPVFSLARLRGPWNGQPLYDFEHCCTKGAESAGESLTLDAMVGAGSATYDPPPDVGAGSLQLGVPGCFGYGHASAYSVQVGSGNVPLAAAEIVGSGLSSAYSVAVGIGKPQFGPMLCAAVGLSTPPYFVGGGAKQFGALFNVGIGLSSAYSVNVAKVQRMFASMALAGTGQSNLVSNLGSGNLPIVATTSAGSGLTSAYSVHVGHSLLQTGALLCAATGTFNDPVFSGSGAPQRGAMACAGSGMFDANSVNVGEGDLELGAMLCAGQGTRPTKS